MDLQPTRRIRAVQRWAGATILESDNEAGELPNGCFDKHVIGLTIARPADIELRWYGSHWRKYRTNPSAVRIFPAGHSFACTWQRNRCLAVEIAPALIASVSRDTTDQAIELQPHALLEDLFLANIITEMRNEAQIGCPSGPTYGEALSVMLAAHIVRHYSAAAPRVNASMRLSKAQLRRVLEFIEARIETELTLQQLANVAGLEMYRFVRSFKHSLGVSPHFYIIQQRVERSKQLLLHSKLPLGVIADRCGFSTPSHFAHTFRRITGSAPSAYRQAIRPSPVRSNGG